MKYLCVYRGSSPTPETLLGVGETLEEAFANLGGLDPDECEFFKIGDTVKVRSKFFWTITERE